MQRQRLRKRMVLGVRTYCGSSNLSFSRIFAFQSRWAMMGDAILNTLQIAFQKRLLLISARTTVLSQAVFPLFLQAYVAIHSFHPSHFLHHAAPFSRSITRIPMVNRETLHFSMAWSQQSLVIDSVQPWAGRTKILNNVSHSTSRCDFPDSILLPKHRLILPPILPRIRLPLSMSISCSGFILCEFVEAKIAFWCGPAF